MISLNFTHSVYTDGVITLDHCRISTNFLYGQFKEYVASFLATDDIVTCIFYLKRTVFKTFRL